MLLPSLPTEPDDVDIIGYERIQIKSNDDIHSVAEAVLNNVLENADYGGAGERITYKNLAGRELLEERHDLKERMKRVEEKQEKTDVEIIGFLEVYRRDILDDVDKQGRKKVGEGNQAAHGGDTVADASLYISGERHDVTTLVDLYGLTAVQVSHLGQTGDFDSISTLNADATRRANGLSNIPPDVETAFKTFAKEA